MIQAPRLVDYGDIVREICEDAAFQESTSKRAWGRCKRKYDAIMSETTKSSLEGDRNLNALREMLDSLGYERTRGQIRFHEEFIKASLPHIYTGTEFEEHREDILRRNGLNALRQEVLICTPRRFGKTTACALFCAAMALCTPHAWISIFSTGQRASTMLLEQTSRMLMNVPGGKARILKRNSEQLYVKGDDQVGGFEAPYGPKILIRDQNSGTEFDVNAFTTLILIFDRDALILTRATCDASTPTQAVSR